MAEIQVQIDADGRVTVEIEGVRGPACLEIARALEAALGRVERQELTSEYYATATADADAKADAAVARTRVTPPPKR